MTAADRWEAALAAWAWPEELLAAAPADPWRLDPADLAHGHRGTVERHDAPTDVAAREALPRRGTVLDVGCGTGAGSAALRRAAGCVVGVDPRGAMLERFVADTGAEPGLLRRLAGGAPEVRAVQGRWPDVAAEAGTADVVVSTHVLYDVGEDVAAFVAALTAAARSRVVVELTARHPLHWLAPYVEQLHGIRRPAEPTAETAIELITEVTGQRPTVLRWTRQLDPPTDRDAFARTVARRCCVGEDRLDDVHTALHRVPPPDQQALVGLVWPGTAG